MVLAYSTTCRWVKALVTDRELEGSHELRPAQTTKQATRSQIGMRIIAICRNICTAVKIVMFPFLGQALSWAMVHPDIHRLETEIGNSEE